MLAGPALSACGAAHGETDPSAIGGSLDEIIARAQKEGTVRLMGYPETWANYRGHFRDFEKKYGVKVHVDSLDAHSAEELQAVLNLQGQSTQPDVLDVGYSFTSAAIEQGLIESYKPSNFDVIPENLKAPDGLWVGAYYGVISVGINRAACPVPHRFEDLLRPEYRGKVAMPGDPRKGAASIATVCAAATARGGSVENAGPGIEYFAELAHRGNLVSVADAGQAMSTGQAAAIFDWNYNWLGREEQLRRDGIDFEYVVLDDGVFGNYYAQPITIGSPQPNAARLWVDWLTSDEGAEHYALGGAIPARFTELVAAGALSEEALAKLPEPSILEQVTLPTPAQGDAANVAIATRWGREVVI